MTHAYIDHAIVMLRQVEQQVAEDFVSMDRDQLNWKPSESTWSIAECLDHIIQTNEQYLLKLEVVKHRTNKVPWWGRIPGWKKLCGNMILQAVDPDGHSKSNTFDVFQPVSSDYPRAIAEDLVLNLHKLTSMLRELDHYEELGRTALTSPVSNSIVLRLETAVEILWKHTVRHLRQAQRVAHMPGFPPPAP